MAFRRNILVVERHRPKWKGAALAVGRHQKPSRESDRERETPDPHEPPRKWSKEDAVAGEPPFIFLSSFARLCRAAKHIPAAASHPGLRPRSSGRAHES